MTGPPCGPANPFGRCVKTGGGAEYGTRCGENDEGQWGHDPSGYDQRAESPCSVCCAHASTVSGAQADRGSGL